MVRIIVGTLIMVGQGKIESQDIQHIIKSRNRNKAGFVSEAKGLCLKSFFMTIDIEIKFYYNSNVMY